MTGELPQCCLAGFAPLPRQPVITQHSQLSKASDACKQCFQSEVTCGGRPQSPPSGSRLSGPAGLEVSGSNSRLYCPWWSTYSEALEQMLAYRAPWLPASGIRFEHTQLRDGDPAGGQAWWQSHFSGRRTASHCRVTLLEHGSVRRSAPWCSPLQRPFARWAPRHPAGPPETPSSAEMDWKTGLSGCCHSAAVPPPPRSQRHTC